MSLRELYQDIIVDHGKNPRNFSILKEANHHQEGYNPLCGDKVTLYVNECDGVVCDISFQGCGCAIAMASASLMTQIVKGKTVKEIAILFECFQQLVMKGDASSDNLGKLMAFRGVFEFPARVKCATLAWHTLKAVLANEKKPVSTE